MYENLLDRYGLKIDDTKKFSISFLDGYLSCGYSIFLKYIAGIKAIDVDIPRKFGSGCHRGLAKINTIMKEGLPICAACKHSCKLDSVEKVNAMKVPLSECKVKQLMMEEFFKEFNEDFENFVLETLEKPKEDIIEAFLEHKKLAYRNMCSAIFERQPLGKVLVTEQKVDGVLGSTPVMGIVDLSLGVKDKETLEPKTLVLDYKTTGSSQTQLKFPRRQLALYTYMLREKGVQVNGNAALYMLKKAPPKKPRKGSLPFSQTVLKFKSLDNPEYEAEYQNTIRELKDDLEMANEGMHRGIFLKNTNHMFCPCALAPYCQNIKLFEEALANKSKTYDTAEESKKELQNLMREADKEVVDKEKIAAIADLVENETK